MTERAIHPMNESVEFSCACNCMTSGILPKPGSIELGEAGAEFVAGEGARRVRMAWGAIVLVRVEIFRGEVRELEFHTDDGQVTVIIPDDGAELVRALGAHLPRDVFEAVS